MNIINHGVWSRYTPEVTPHGLPENVMFCRRDNDLTDWYDYIYNGASFAPGSVKAVVMDGRVKVASTDGSRLFPQVATLIEITGYTGSDPQSDFVGMTYDSVSNTLNATPPDPILKVPASSAKLVLDDDGIYHQVENICLNHPVLAVKIYWTTATIWERYNPYVLAIGAEMNLTEAQMDEMFRRANLK